MSRSVTLSADETTVLPAIVSKALGFPATPVLVPNKQELADVVDMLERRGLSAFAAFYRNRL